jgi:hypothetical protein
VDIVDIVDTEKNTVARQGLLPVSPTPSRKNEERGVRSEKRGKRRGGRNERGKR